MTKKVQTFTSFPSTPTRYLAFEPHVVPEYAGRLLVSGFFSTLKLDYIRAAKVYRTICYHEVQVPGLCDAINAVMRYPVPLPHAGVLPVHPDP